MRTVESRNRYLVKQHPSAKQECSIIAIFQDNDSPLADNCDKQARINP